MEPQPRVVTAQVRHEIEKIRGSRFIATVLPITSPESVPPAVQRLREELRDANHHAWAWRIGAGRDHHRYSDDGEPSGTAGRPILQQIDHWQLTNTLVIVSRIFGGTKLGTGGLVRAYGGAASAALDRADTRPWVMTRRVTLSYAYELSGAVDATLAARGLVPETSDYGAEVRRTLVVPEAQAQELIDAVRESSAGRVRTHLEDPRPA